jgi:hypothetical protein
MYLDKKKNKALESVKGAILRFRNSLTREDEDGWKFYREAEYAFNDMVARAKMLCGCQHCAAPNPAEPQYCYCSGSKQVECKCRR